MTTHANTQRKLLKGVKELHAYVERNQQFVPNYGERYRNGERIASGFVESAVNQVVSKPNGQAPTDAVEPTRRSSAVANPHAGAQ